MKQRILVAVASLVLAALILLLLPVAPIEPDVGTCPTQNPTFTKPTDGTTVTTPQTTGIVRLYSCDEAVLAVFDQLAEDYKALTGVKVEVLRSGADGCQTTLQQYMATENAPTVLCVHSQSQLKTWKTTLLDLQDTALAAALCNQNFGLWMDDKMLAIPMAVEGYGLLVNAELMAGVALTRSDITDFTSLATAVQILKDNAIKAFPATDFTLQNAWCLLLGGDAEAARRFIDLYLVNCNKSGTSQELFLRGKSAFYLGGTWEYDTLASAENSGLHVRNLDILPTYGAGAMQYVCSTGWGVNADASREDIEATVAFLTWMVTKQEGTTPVDQLQKLSPFVDATWYGNQLEKRLRGYMTTETVQIQWKDAGITANRLLMALNQYAQNSTDETWNDLCTAVSVFKAENGYY